jgi:hypothetical protein
MCQCLILHKISLLLDRMCHTYVNREYIINNCLDIERLNSIKEECQTCN